MCLIKQNVVHIEGFSVCELHKKHLQEQILYFWLHKVFEYEKHYHVTLM